MKQQHKTDVQCPLCEKGKIVAEVESVATMPERMIPIGPASRDYYRLQISSFYCNQCQVMFHHPPGKPNMGNEILQKIRDQEPEF